VFHVSKLKKHVREVVTSSYILKDDTSVIAYKEPESILDHIIVKRNNKIVTKDLSRRKHQFPE